MKKALVFFTFIMAVSVFAQDIDTKIYYYKGNYKLANDSTALLVKKVEKINDSIFDITKYYKDNKEWKPYALTRLIISNDSLIKMKIRDTDGNEYLQMMLLKKDSLTKNYNYKLINEDGIVIEAGQTSQRFPLVRQGEITFRYNDNTISEKAIYKEGVFLSNKNWTKEGEEYVSNIAPLVDKQPDIEGKSMARVLRKHIIRTFNYPEAAKKQDISGSVLVKFVLMEDMTISGVVVTKGVHPLLDEEAKRIISSLEFKGTPAISDGEAVRILFSIPITFRLAD